MVSRSARIKSMLSLLWRAACCSHDDAPILHHVGPLSHAEAATTANDAAPAERLSCESSSPDATDKCQTAASMVAQTTAASKIPNYFTADCAHYRQVTTPNITGHSEGLSVPKASAVTAVRAEIGQRQPEAVQQLPRGSAHENAPQGELAEWAIASVAIAAATGLGDDRLAGRCKVRSQESPTRSLPGVGISLRVSRALDAKENPGALPPIHHGAAAAGVDGEAVLLFVTTRRTSSHTNLPSTPRMYVSDGAELNSTSRTAFSSPGIMSGDGSPALLPRSKDAAIQGQCIASAAKTVIKEKSSTARNTAANSAKHRPAVKVSMLRAAELSERPNSETGISLKNSTGGTSRCGLALSGRNLSGPPPMLSVHRLSKELTNLRMLGRGASGPVYKAEWKGTLVAAKFIPMDDGAHPVQRCGSNSGSLKAHSPPPVSHPHVVPIYACATIDADALLPQPNSHAALLKPPLSPHSVPLSCLLPATLPLGIPVSTARPRSCNAARAEIPESSAFSPGWSQMHSLLDSGAMGQGGTWVMGLTSNETAMAGYHTECLLSRGSHPSQIFPKDDDNNDADDAEVERLLIGTHPADDQRPGNSGILSACIAAAAVAASSHRTTLSGQSGSLSKLGMPVSQKKAMQHHGIQSSIADISDATAEDKHDLPQKRGFSFELRQEDQEVLCVDEALESMNLRQGQRVMVTLMEYCDCGSLSSVMKVFQPSKRWGEHSPMRALIRSASEIAQGLARMHALGITHGNLKPSNILLKSSRTDQRGFICLLTDAGQQGDTAEGGGSADIGGLNLVFPENAFTAPEALHGQATPASDVWSFGIILYEMQGVKFPTPAHPEDQPGGISLEPAWSESSLPPLLRKIGEACTNLDASKRPSAMTVSKGMSYIEHSLKATQSSRPSLKGSHTACYPSAFQAHHHEAQMEQRLLTTIPLPDTKVDVAKIAMLRLRLE